MVERLTGQSAWRWRIEIRAAVGGVRAVDVITTTPEEMEDRRDGIIHVLAIAQQEGKVLYAA